MNNKIYYVATTFSSSSLKRANLIGMLPAVWLKASWLPGSGVPVLQRLTAVVSNTKPSLSPSGITRSKLSSADSIESNINRI